MTKNYLTINKESIPSSQLFSTPVMFAASHDKPIILEQLLSKGGNPNNIDPANPLQQSPLGIALFRKILQQRLSSFY
ncbi:ankyrin repeat domain-containing protein [Endozoicomonas sp. YOMI1]|uniref:ankyrin repeat domain-containing protein n=1 Tax=Endozoicomonas sp. YOMI1 TaxID=2828739 RepID=UPI00214800FF|nr:ankyrin repeat domain-containing protein [Endozoicomonas sp. YOMI1]